MTTVVFDNGDGLYAFIPVFYCFPAWRGSIVIIQTEDRVNEIRTNLIL